MGYVPQPEPLYECDLEGCTTQFHRDDGYSFPIFLALAGTSGATAFQDVQAIGCSIDHGAQIAVNHLYQVLIPRVKAGTKA